MNKTHDPKQSSDINIKNSDSNLGAQGIFNAPVAIHQSLSPDQMRPLVAQLSQALTPSTPLPQVSELFKIILDPSEIPAAIFRATAGHRLFAYEVPYIEGRQGVSNVQDDLYRALMRSGGALAVHSRAGIGKTREVVELAVRLAKEGWVICVAKGEGDARMDAPVAFPDELRGSQVLFVIDDLHRRIGAVSANQVPYLERLDAFLSFFDRSLSPGEFYAVATVRSEPHFQRQLEFNSQQLRLRRFALYALSEFSLIGLKTVLTTLAAQAKVKIQADGIEELVNNSDRTLRTLVMNVEDARQQNVELSRQSWLPSQGRSWEVRFQEARARWPNVDHVFKTLHIIHQAGLPTRLMYVVQLGTKLAETDITLATDGLINMGLLGMYHQVVDAFGDEQLTDSLRNTGIELPVLEEHWTFLVESVVEIVEVETQWVSDIVLLASRLVTVDRSIDAEELVTRAIEQGMDDANVYYQRGIARYWQDKEDLAEADYDAAIERGMDDANVYYNRGLARQYQNKYSEAEADFDAAIERGMDDTDVYYQRGLARRYQNKYSEAEADFDAAIERGMDDTDVYYQRGLARHFQRKHSKAEHDYDAALARGKDDATAYYNRGLARQYQNKYSEAEADYDAAIERGMDDANVYYRRGLARYLQDKEDLAEADYDAAIERGMDDANVYYIRGLAYGGQGKHYEAEADFDVAIERGMDDANVYYNRGLARQYQNKYSEAEADYDAAIERGMNDANVYSQRGIARYWQDKEELAEADYDAAIERGMDDANVYYNRGLARYWQDKEELAEADYDAAIERGMDDTDVYYQRGLARRYQNKYSEAEADFDAAIERGMDDTDVYYQRGLAREVQRKHSEAEADYVIAIARGRDDASVYYGRAVVRVRLGKQNEADLDFDAAVKRRWKS